MVWFFIVVSGAASVLVFLPYADDSGPTPILFLWFFFAAIPIGMNDAGLKSAAVILMLAILVLAFFHWRWHVHRR